MSALLEVTDLKTRIRLRSTVVHAVDGLSFHVEQGETVGIVGESGCGKSITAMSIIRLLPARAFIAEGSVKLDGRELTSLSSDEIRRVRGNEIGMIFQDPMTSLNPTMTIGNQIAEAVTTHRDVSRAQAMERAREVLGLVGLPRPAERLSDYPHQLSGGLRQRVMIAIALACEPKLLIADEPTTALDVTIQAQILGLLDSIKEQLGMGIILITHDMGVIAGRADRVVVMYAGQKVESAATGTLFSHVRHPYTEALLASIPRLGQDKSKPLYSIPGIPPDLRDPPEGCRFAVRCAFATSECFATPPPLISAVDDGDHAFACYHPRDLSSEQIATHAEGLIERSRHRAATRIGEGVPALGSEVAAVPDLPVVLEVLSPAPAAVVPGSDGAGDAARSGTVLEFRAVTKEFAVTGNGILRRSRGALHAVTEVTLAVRRGETFGLVGESGCGKTTLGRLGVAFETPTAGEVLFNGADLNRSGARQLRELRRQIQFMFQDPYASLDPRMRVQEIVSEPLDVARRGTKRERRETVRRLLADVGLPPDAAARYPHEFSGGQRQRLGLARALALNPQVIVADEPVSALDVSIQSQVLNLMQRIQATYGLTYIVISHDLSVVRYLADRIGVMYLGRLVEIGSGDDIYQRPAHPYTAGLLDAIPEPEPATARAKAKAGPPIRGELPSPLHPPSGCPFRTRCPRAQELCAEVMPELRAFGGEHRAACHYPLLEPAVQNGSQA